MNLEESGTNLMKLIRSSKISTEKTPDGYLAFFAINVSSLTEEERELLGELMVGTFSNNVFKNYIADNNEMPIIFTDEKSASGTLLKEGRSLEKKFQFSLFSEKRVMIDIPKSQVMSFIPKKQR